MNASPGGDGEEPWEDDPGPVAPPIEPGSPSPENVAFVILGVLAALFVLARVGGLV